MDRNPSPPCPPNLPKQNWNHPNDITKVFVFKKNQLPYIRYQDPLPLHPMTTKTLCWHNFNCIGVANFKQPKIKLS
jgi:hypothetical protein